MFQMLSLAVLLAVVQSAPEVKAKYECAGTVPQGSYQLTLTIEQKADNYFLSWKDGVQIGLGIRTGDQLSVAFLDVRTGNVGVVVYEVKEGQLLGVWAAGDGKIYRENCLVGAPSRNARR